MDKRIIAAMLANFRTILENHGDCPKHDPTGLLLRCLACMVFHSCQIMEVIDRNPGHELSMVPLFGTDSNLQELIPLVTTNPTPGVMETVTGIPPHVEVVS